MKKLKDAILYKDDGHNAFPFIAGDADGTLYMTFRHAPRKIPVTHIDEQAAAYFVCSTDGGETWSEPNAFIKDATPGISGACVNVLKNGNVLVTVFYWRFMERADIPLREEVLPYQNIARPMPDGKLAYCEGTYSFISKDKGITFEGPFCIEKGYANIGRCVELPDGTLLAPIHGFYADGNGRAVLYASRNGGRVWEPYAHVWRDLSGRLDANEPTLVFSASGELCCFIRTEEYLCYCKSANNGKTWTQPVHTDIIGRVPCDAIRLKDGRMLLAYGRRQKPFGIRALLLDKEMNGITSENEFVIRDDGLGFDISYASAVQLPDGRVLTVYYFYTGEDDGRRHIAGSWLSV